MISFGAYVPQGTRDLRSHAERTDFITLGHALA